MEEKKEFRRKALQHRRELPDRERASLQIQREALMLVEKRRPDRVFLYASYRSEVDTWQLLQWLWDRSFPLALPKVCGRELSFYQVSSKRELAPGCKGILEPMEDSCPLVTPGRESLIFVPGAAFSQNGERMGYGAGFYDRLLSSCPQTMTVALAFFGQIYETLPTEDTDIRVRAVLTENGFLDCWS